MAAVCCHVFASWRGVEPVVTVDECFELNSIVWRLEGANEYSQCNIPTYAADIDTFFAPYREHPLIKYCDELRETAYIGYDAVSNAAGRMTIRDGHVIAVSDTAAACLERMDKRWTAGRFTEYVRLMDDFYSKSSFKKFFRQHGDLYRTAESEFQKNVMNVGLKWFADFWGEDINSYTVYLSLTNGPSNYGNIPVAGSDNAVLVGCCYSTDSLVATYETTVITILIHELMHKLANPVAERHACEFASAVDKVYPVVAGRLADAAYDKEAVMPEWFTRLGTLCFLGDCNLGPMYVERSLYADKQKGFIWQDKAYQLMLDSFYTDRGRYRHFEDFVPRLAVSLEDFVSDTADLATSPSVVNAYFNVDGKISLSETDTLKVTFVFSEDMSPKRGVEMMADNGEVLSEQLKKMSRNMPKEKQYSWIDKRTLSVVVPTEYMKGIGQFTVRVHLSDFVSQRGVNGVGFSDVTLPVVE